MTIQERIAQVKEFIAELETRTDFGAELELMSLEAHLEELAKQGIEGAYDASKYIWACSVDNRDRLDKDSEEARA
ncbi:hypothetical protein DM558_07700 [Entomomonas moraniae]|uniref:Uncharacterized protein n=1 Tax=Entomomonas moraniae TaxID=2213226 RepID=A0A3Q9JJ43_9GAMM|nr:hypothetical protein [Entomomonas moraniae]AZS50669.1 hypothetical protein DM558_07700 [Entomomonas moraniae]